MRRWVLALVGAVVAALVTVVVMRMWKSDDDLIKESIGRFTKAVGVKEGDNPISRTARIKSELAETVEADVHVSVEELGVEVSGRKDLAAEATRVGMFYQRAKADVVRVSIKREPSALVASADATVRVVGERGGAAREDLREIHFLMVKSEGRWLIRSMDVRAATQAQ
ncbi:MAG: hypothetical protein R3B36_07925 [Polyangiaceae bacterium]